MKNLAIVVFSLFSGACIYAAAGRDLRISTNFCCTGVCGDNAQITCNYVNAVGDERIFTLAQLSTINFIDYGTITQTEEKKIAAPTETQMIGGKGQTSLGELAHVPLAFIAIADFQTNALNYTLYRRVGNDTVWREFGKISTPVKLDELFFYVTPDGFAIWADNATKQLRAINLSASPKPKAKL